MMLCPLSFLQKGCDFVIVERLEHFKDFQKRLKLQNTVILGKKEFLTKACEVNISEEVRNRLFTEVKQEEGKINEILLDEMKERQELEYILSELIADDRIRTILIVHYLQGKTLKDIAFEMGFSYDYIRELCSNGRKMLKQVV